MAVTFLGDVKGPITRMVRLPGGGETFAAAAEDGGQMAPTPNLMRVSPFPNVLESGINGDAAHATATDLLLPVAFNGIVRQRGWKGFFRFHAKKGMALDLTVFARQLRSPLDSVLTVYDAKGRQLASNDDATGPDSYLRFNVPADGDYGLSVQDQMRRAARPLCTGWRCGRRSPTWHSPFPRW